MSKLREAAEKVEMRPGDKLGAITVGLHDDPGIVLLRRIVDSISIVNRMACWDHFAMFELRDYLCERAELAKPDHFPDAGKMVQDGWIPVAERMPDSGCVVLACYRNSAGNLRRIRAEWVAAKTQESDGDSDIGEYDEATDTYYDPQGWYERIDNWDDGFSAVGVSQGEVTHWMHLPDAPGAAAPRPAPAEPQVAERGLRELLAGRIAGAMLYHDDGELQDNSAHPCIDFLRDSAETIKQKLMERAIAGLENLTNPPTPTPQPAGGEPQPAAQQEPVPEGYMLVLVPKESPGGKPDWDECIRQSEVATGLKVDRNTFSIIKREVRRWLAQCHASQPAEEQAGERKPLTEAQIDRHSIAAADCPPSSTVILVSSLRRLLGITATKGDRHD